MMNFWHAIFHVVLYKYWGLIIIICNFSCSWFCQNSNVLPTSFFKVQSSCKQWDVNISINSDKADNDANHQFLLFLSLFVWNAYIMHMLWWNNYGENGYFCIKWLVAKIGILNLQSTHPPLLRSIVSHCICNRKNQEKILLLCLLLLS